MWWSKRIGLGEYIQHLLEGKLIANYTFGENLDVSYIFYRMKFYKLKRILTVEDCENYLSLFSCSEKIPKDLLNSCLTLLISANLNKDSGQNNFKEVSL